MSDRSAAIFIAVWALWAFVWISPQEPGNTQVVTRLGLTLAIVETGQLTIDNVAARTIDKAEFEGRYYADKTPGHSLLAIPAVMISRQVFTVMGWPADSAIIEVFDRYALAATIGTNGLISALAVALIFLVARRLGASSAGAVFAAGALALATPFFGWSTAFFAHSVSGSLTLIALAIIIAASDGRSLPLWSLAGVVMGYCTAVDLTTAPTLVLLGVLGLYLAVRNGNVGRSLAGLMIGGIIGALPLLIYNQLAFNDPFRLGYSSVVGFEGMQQGLFGVRMPDPGVMAELLFGLYRGLLPLSPVLLLVPLGLLVMARRQATQPFAVVIALAFTIHLLINGGYFYWNGGWSVGPRHLVPALPLLSIGLAFAWPERGWAQVAVSGLLLVSLMVSLISAAGTMFAPEELRNPFFEWSLPRALQPEALWRSAPVLLSWAGFSWQLWTANKTRVAAH